MHLVILSRLNESATVSAYFREIVNSVINHQGSALRPTLIFPSGYEFPGLLILSLSQAQLSAILLVVSKSEIPASISDLSLFEFLLRNTPDQVYFKDKEGRFLRISYAVAEQFGSANPDEVIGKTDRDYCTAEFAEEAACDEQKIIRTGESLIGKIEKAIHSDGGIAWTYTTKLPLRNPQGEIIGICGINKDFTAVQEMEEALRIERDRLLEITAKLQERNTQLDKDLAMAREIQEALLPRDYPTFASNTGGLGFANYYRPATMVGGDFFGVFALSPTRAGVFVCDVMGHGLRAALVTAIIRGVLEELKPKMNDPGHFMELVNLRLRSILKHSNEPFIATAFYLIADTDSEEVLFANAGHPAPICVGYRQGTAEPLCNNSANGHTALGLFENSTYTTGRHPFVENDRLLIFTDGLYEVESAQGEQFGRSALIASFLRYSGLSAERQCAAVVAAVSSFSGKDDFDDDVCLVAIERTPGNGGGAPCC